MKRTVFSDDVEYVEVEPIVPAPIRPDRAPEPHDEFARREQEEKTLTERLNEAYRDDDLEPEEREFLELTREHFGRLDDE